MKLFRCYLKIYPNPSSHIITFASSDLMNDDCQLKIFDVYGRIVSQQIFIHAKNQIRTDISSFSKGIYFVEINQNNKILRGKFLKE